jgi:hypothetical protein
LCDKSFGMRSYFLFCSLLVICWVNGQRSYAQTDFRQGVIITLDNDSIPGWVDYRGLQRNSKVCTFKKNEAAEAREYSPKELRGYRILGGRTYESKVVKLDSLNQESLFLEVLVKGKASLYYYKLIDQDHFLVEVGNEGVTELVESTMTVERNGIKYSGMKKTYRGLLKYLLADCNRINPLIELVELQELSLAHLIRQYNQCMAAGGDMSAPYVPPVSFKVGLKAGVITARAWFPGGPNSALEEGYYNAPASLTYGLYLNTLLPRFSEKISFQTEVLYVRNQFDNYKEFKNIYRITRSTIRMDVSYLKVPILFQYTYSKGKIRPFVQAGAFTAFALKVNSIRRNEIEQSYNNVVDTEEKEAFAIKKFQAGYFGGAGFRYMLKNQRFLFIEARMEKGNGLDLQTGVTASHSTVTYTGITAGFGL